MCFHGFCVVSGISNTRLRRIVEAVEEGRLEPFADERQNNAGRPKSSCMHADSFFSFAYMNLAEPLAEGVVEQEDMNNMSEDEGAEADAAGSLAEQWAMSGNPIVEASVAAEQREVRWLPPCTVSDLFEQYQVFSDVEGDKASFSTFRRIYKTTWHSVLRMRKSSQHARCTDCAKFSKMRAQAKTEKDRAKIQKALGDHLQSMFDDRSADARINNLAKMGVQGKVVGDRVLSLTIVGMDQAKFRIPRNTDSAKELEGLWRPQAHFTGVLAAGVLDAFYMTNCDPRKDSNSNASLLSRTLDHVNDILQEKGLTMPEHLCLLVWTPTAPCFLVP